MFNGASAFNQDLSGWNTGAVTSMQFMFNGASAFNQDLSDWNTGSVTNMGCMFQEALAFNQTLCWSLKQGAETTDMFHGSGGSIGCPSKSAVA
jgi:surface protein